MVPSSTLTTSPSASPFIPLRPPSTSERRCFRVSLPHCSSSSSSSPPPSPSQSLKDLKGIELVVDKLSLPLRLATSSVFKAEAIVAGYGLGTRFGGTRNAALGGAVALGVVGGAAAYALNTAALKVATANLYNYVAGLDHPSMLKKEDIDGIANSLVYGVNKQDEAFKSEICDIYCQFVSSVLPPGGEELKSDEVDKITSFKNSLGIDDPDAVAMHI